VHRQPAHPTPGASHLQAALADVQRELQLAAQAVHPQDASCLHHQPRADEMKGFQAGGWLLRQQLHRQPSAGEAMRGAPEFRHQADGSTDARTLLRRQSCENPEKAVRSAKTERSPVHRHPKRLDPTDQRRAHRARDADCG
jgi:hypothetical protein